MRVRPRSLREAPGAHLSEPTPVHDQETPCMRLSYGYRENLRM